VTPSPTYVDEVGAAWYPDVLQPIEATAKFELAANGSTGSGVDGGGSRFAYDSGDREIAAVQTPSVNDCQSACIQRDACRGVVFNGTWCMLVNDSAALTTTSLPSQSFRRIHSGMMLAPGTARAVWVALTVPQATPPGRYTGSVIISVTELGHGSSGVTPSERATTNTTATTGMAKDGAPTTFIVTVPVSLTVWPIAPECLEAETRTFGSAWGFDHSVIPLLYQAIPVPMRDAFARFTDVRHISSSGLTGWNNLDGHGSVLTREGIDQLLMHQDLFCAAELGITPHSPNASDINATWVAAKLATIEARIANLSAWGVLNRSYIYAFDEAGPECVCPTILCL